jgi:hypothetical protein
MCVLSTLSAAILFITPFALPPADAFDANRRLEAVLREWSKANRETKSFHATVKFTTLDKTFQQIEVRHVEVSVRKPDLVRRDVKDDKAKLIEIWLQLGDTWHWYNSVPRHHTVFPPLMELPTLAKSVGWAWLSDLIAATARVDNWVYVELPVEEVRQHCSIHLVKEDQWWTYLQVEPKPSDTLRAHFRHMRVVLNRKTRLVRQIWLEQPNGTEMRWDFERLETDVRPPITVDSLSRDLPQGWELRELTKFKDLPK